MPEREAPCVELGSVPRTPSIAPSPSPSEISSASSPEPQNIRPTPLFRALALPPPEPVQPPGQDELERRLPGYRRIVIPRELTLIELLKQYSGVTSDEEVLGIREAKLRVVAERVGLRRLHVLAPRLRSLTLDGSALSSLRDLGIGLVHLKVLSVNRCGLTCLDGVWGLGALREFHAAGNRLQDLQPLAALQKLHTLNLADNPIAESSRLWTLGICGALRRLTLSGTPLSDLPEYRTLVASALPLLISLDERPLHQNEEIEDIFDDALSSSDSEREEELLPRSQASTSLLNSEPGPSKKDNTCESDEYVDGDSAGVPQRLQKLRCRPATTEGVGVRPLRPVVPTRPRTAQERPTIDAPTRLQILNTLMDKEWRCSGSRLTSQGAFCGNLARALRRPPTAHRRSPENETEKEILEQTLAQASRSIAAEIPAIPRLEDWAKFRETTGIEINIDFNERPKGIDPLTAIERLEKIEKETFERLKENNGNDNFESTVTNYDHAGVLMSEDDLWRNMIFDTTPDSRDLDSLFNDCPPSHSSDDSFKE